MVWSPTASTSADSASRSTSSRSRALNAATVLAASYLRRLKRRSANRPEIVTNNGQPALGVTARRKGFGQGAVYVWSMPADPPKPMAQGTHGMDAMDATGHDVVEGGAHLFEYDLDDPGRVTR
jgi:hypothetical protein